MGVFIQTFLGEEPVAFDPATVVFFNGVLLALVVVEFSPILFALANPGGDLPPPVVVRGEEDFGVPGVAFDVLGDEVEDDDEDALPVLIEGPAPAPFRLGDLVSGLGEEERGDFNGVFPPPPPPLLLLPTSFFVTEEEVSLTELDLRAGDRLLIEEAELGLFGEMEEPLFDEDEDEDDSGAAIPLPSGLLMLTYEVPSLLDSSSIPSKGMVSIDKYSEKGEPIGTSS
jgi:hypothetical protein